MQEAEEAHTNLFHNNQHEFQINSFGQQPSSAIPKDIPTKIYDESRFILQMNNLSAPTKSVRTFSYKVNSSGNSKGLAITSGSRPLTFQGSINSSNILILALSDYSFPGSRNLGVGQLVTRINTKSFNTFNLDFYFDFEIYHSDNELRKIGDEHTILAINKNNKDNH